MNITISYNEISKFVSTKFNVKLEFEQMDEKTLAVLYKPGNFLPALHVNLHFDAICADSIVLSYNCSKATDLLIVGAVLYLQKKIPNGIVVDTSQKRIHVALNKLGDFEEILTNIMWAGITLEKESANVALIFR